MDRITAIDLYGIAVVDHAEGYYETCFDKFFYSDLTYEEQRDYLERSKAILSNPRGSRGPTTEIKLNLTKREIELLRNCTSDLGTSEHECVSLQMKIANAILDATERD